MLRLLRFPLLTILFLLACEASGPVARVSPPDCGVDTAPGGEGPRILFLGNSLTYSFDIPAILAALLTQADVPFERIEMIAQPNFGLEDHWSSPVVHEAIARGWDLVVMQQGPSATEGRPSLLEYSGQFATEIRAAGGEPAMFMVWPSASRIFDFEGVSDSYAMAAEQIDGLLFPVGEAWRAAWAVDPDLPLYDTDGFHPSALGSLLAALVMFEQVAGRVAPALATDFCIPYFGSLGLTPERAALLVSAATQANTEFARTP